MVSHGGGVLVIAHGVVVHGVRLEVCEQQDCNKTCAVKVKQLQLPERTVWPHICETKLSQPAGGWQVLLLICKSNAGLAYCREAAFVRFVCM